MLVREWIEQNQVTMTVRRVKVRADGLMTDCARHWRCGIRRPGAAGDLMVDFSQGSAHTKPPTVAEVLGCVVDDVQGYSNAGSFETWCAEYGYDTDSCKAEKIYNLIGKHALALFTFAGDAAGYDAVLGLDRDD